MNRGLPLAAVFLLLAPPSVLAGQRIAGSVTERDTGKPIASALLQLLAGDSTVLRTVLTDTDGRFALAVDGCEPRDGYLYVAHLGYRELRAALQDLPADCSQWAITLEADPVALPELGVQVSRNRDLERTGFYNRQRLGLGTFVTRELIQERYPTSTQVAEILRQVPGVSRVEQFMNESAIYLRLASNLIGGPCPAAIYIDGLFYERTLFRLPAQDVEAIELYRGPAQVPAQYGGAYAACGVVLVWTRVGTGR